MRDVVVILPDIRSTHNTGSFFRTADASGVSKIILTGFTATPPHPNLIKVSLGAEESVPWEYVEDTQQVIAQLKTEGYQIVVVEQTSNSVDFTAAEYAQKVAVIFGHEVEGVSPAIIEQADICIEIPMRGAKESLNVSVSGGIVLYELLR